MRSDEERLLDIIDESGLVLKYVPATREEFDADEVVQAALTRWLQNIGEAASRLSPELRSRHHEVPWQSITGMRHRVVYDYFSPSTSRWSAELKDRRTRAGTAGGGHPPGVAGALSRARATRANESAPNTDDTVSGLSDASQHDGQDLYHRARRAAT